MQRNILISALVITVILLSFYIYCAQTLHPPHPINYTSKIRFTCMIILHIFGIIMFVLFIYVQDNLQYAYWSLILCIFNSICISFTEIWVQMKVGGGKIDHRYMNRPIQLALVNCYFLIYMYSLIGLILSSIFILVSQLVSYYQRRRLRMALQQHVINVGYEEWMSEIDCAICLSQYCESDSIVKINCKHMFHQQCVQSWIKLNKNCPLCRAQMFPSD